MRLKMRNFISKTKLSQFIFLHHLDLTKHQFQIRIQDKLYEILELTFSIKSFLP